MVKRNLIVNRKFLAGIFLAAVIVFTLFSICLCYDEPSITTIVTPQGSIDAAIARSYRIKKAILITTGIAAIIGILSVCIFRVGKSAKPKHLLYTRVREALTVQPDDAYKLYKEYKALKGSPWKFTPDELFKIYSASDCQDKLSLWSYELSQTHVQIYFARQFISKKEFHKAYEVIETLKKGLFELDINALVEIYSGENKLDDLLEKDISQLSDPQNLQLAKRLVELHENEKSASVLRDTTCISAISIKDGCEDVLGIYARAGRLDEFVGQHCRGQSPAFYSAYARALMKMNKYSQALVLFSRKLPEQITQEDVSDIFALHMRLGNFGQVRMMIDRVFQGKPVQSNSEFYYSLALLCEDEEQFDLAQKIYQHFVDVMLDYRDTAQRNRKMKELLAVKAKPAVQASAAPGFSSGQGGLLEGKYELKREIGAGGMGMVYEGWDHQLNRLVAIKKMRSELKAYPKERDHFIQEAKLVGRLSHPYIVGIHAIVEKDGEIYLVLDYVDGKPLSAILEEKERLPLEDCKDIFNYVCRAVDYAHKQKVIHRDLKPSNIMVDTNNFARVMDFGLARELDSIRKLTRQSVAGTPAYMAPEQYHGIVRPEADVYAMGVCLYEMLAGDIPFRGIDVQTEKEQMRFKELSLVLPWLSKGAKVDEFIRRALEPDPAERIASAMEFLTLLGKI